MQIDEEFVMVNRVAFNVLPTRTPEWSDFIVPILNKARWDLPAGQRIGQRVMNALGELHPEMFNKIAGTHFDVWEVSSGHSQTWELFFSRVFELFVESL